MSRRCQITGKGPSFGNNVAHSKKRTRKKFLPNLLVKKIHDPKTGRMVKVKIAASTLRTLTKNLSK